jgi:preprotein translocase subunit SecD
VCLASMALGAFIGMVVAFTVSLLVAGLVYRSDRRKKDKIDGHDSAG